MNTLDDVEYGLEEIASMESFGLKLGKFIGLITVEENNYGCKPLPVFAIETTDFEIDGVLSIATFEYIDGEYISYVLKGNEKYKTGNMVGVSSIGDTIYNVAANSLKDFKQGKFKTKLHALFTEERPDTSKDKPNKVWWKFWG